MDKITIKGIKNFYNKHEQPSCIIHYTQDFEDWEKNSDKSEIFGLTCQSAYISNSHMPQESIDKEFNIIWGKGFKGMAVINGLSPVIKK